MFFGFLCYFLLLMFQDNIVKISENLNKWNLLKPASSLPALPISA